MRSADYSSFGGTDSNGLFVRWISLARSAGVFALVVFISCLVGIFSRMPGTLAVVWFTNALLLGLLLRNPKAAHPLTWLGAAGGYLAADLVTGSDLGRAVLLNSANLVGVVVGYYAFRHMKPVDLRLERALSVAWLSALAVLAGTCAAAIGGIVEVVLFDGAWWRGWMGWFGIEVINYAVVLPLVLTFPTGRSRTDIRDYLSTHWRQLAVPLALFVGSLGPAWLIGGLGALVFTIPALVASALLANVFVTTLFVAASTAWALVLTVHGRIGLTNPEGIPLSASTLIGLALLAVGPLAIACAMAERERVYEALRQAMTQDDLTGAYRRLEFVRRAKSAVAAAAVRGQPSSLLMMDLDHFKQLNDNLGHQAGDRALIEFAETVRSCMHDGDLFARLGGEEFALLLPNVDCDTSTVIAEAIRTAQERRAQRVFGKMGATVSIGLTCSSRSETNLTELLAVADDALYRAKTLQRNVVVTARLPQLASHGGR